MNDDFIGKEVNSSICKIHFVAWQFQINVYKIYVSIKICSDA